MQGGNNYGQVLLSCGVVLHFRSSDTEFNFCHLCLSIWWSHEYCSYIQYCNMHHNCVVLVWLGSILEVVIKLLKNFFSSIRSGSVASMLSWGLHLVCLIGKYWKVRGYGVHWIVCIFFFLISFQLAHPILESLKGTQHGWLIELLYAFNSGLFCSIFSFVTIIIIAQMFLCLRLCISITKA